MARCLFCCVLIFLSGCVTLCPEQIPFHYPEGRYAGARLEYVRDIPILTVQGTPEEIGEQSAHLALSAAPRLADYPHDLLNRFWAGWSYDYFLGKGKKLLPQFPNHHRREMEALIQHASAIPADAIIAGNTLFDVKKMIACSSLVIEPARSRNGLGMLGRNLDFPDLGYLHEYTLVTICRSPGKHAFAGVGFPGMVGILSGINEKGLTLTMHEVYQSRDDSPKFEMNGVPYALIYRRVLEECATIEQAASLIRSLPRTTSTNVAIMQGNGQGAILEVSVHSVIVRPAVQGVAHCTNHFVSKPLRPRFLWNMFGTKDRDLVLAENSKKPDFSVLDVRKALHAVNKGSHTIQSMVFQTGRIGGQPRFILHLARGPAPTSGNVYQSLDLTPYLLPGIAAHY